MGRRIDPSWWTLRHFSFQPALRDWWDVLFCLWSGVYKNTLLVIGKMVGGGYSVSVVLYYIRQMQYNRKIKCVEYIVK